ncbi:hypothetical protein RIR_jg40036.t1 [Rhizophagus irregularis DAOM 181602=DAOM 197198]|nr:hypothetical protein RIR_jg40036.t1 [Rhizophagus irregularis DAOM 181602=DAOM 197198]
MSYRVSTQNRAKRRTKHSYIHRKFHQHNQRDKINQDTRTKTPPKKHRIIHAPPIIRTTKNISWIQPNQKYRPQLNNSQQQIKDTPLPSHASHHVAHQDKTQLLLKVEKPVSYPVKPVLLMIGVLFCHYHFSGKNSWYYKTHERSSTTEEFLSDIKQNNNNNKIHIFFGTSGDNKVTSIALLVTQQLAKHIIKTYHFKDDF